MGEGSGAGSAWQWEVASHPLPASRGREERLESVPTTSKVKEWVDWECWFLQSCWNLSWAHRAVWFSRHRNANIPCKHSCNSQLDFLPSPLPLDHILCIIQTNLCLSGLSFRISAGGWSMSMSLLGDTQSWLSPLPDSFHQLQAWWWLPVAVWSWSWPTQPPDIHCQVRNKRWNCWRRKWVREKEWGAGGGRARNSPRSRSGRQGQSSWWVFQPGGRAQEQGREDPTCPDHFQPLWGVCGEGGANPPQNSAREEPFTLWTNISFTLRGSVWIR